MELIKSKEQPAKLGLPPSRREWWDLGDGYEIDVAIGPRRCSFWVTSADHKDITYEIAKLFGLDVSKKHLTNRYEGNDEMYASMSINCVAINYTKPENYKELLKKIEAIVNECFKHK